MKYRDKWRPPAQLVTHKMQHKNIPHTNAANKYKQTLQSSKIKAVRLTNCQLITDKLTVFSNKMCGRPPQYAPKLIFDLLTLKVVSESRVTWATSVPILVFLGLTVLDLGPIYAPDRETSDVRRASSLNAPYPRGGGIISKMQSQKFLLCVKSCTRTARSLKTAIRKTVTCFRRL